MAPDGVTTCMAIRARPTGIFPEIRIPVVTVIWIEQRVTTYSEYAMSTSVSGIKNIEAQHGLRDLHTGSG